MTDTKQKCQGCGAETMSDVGWCLACRSILYTDLQIAKSDFRQTEFKTMVFPVRDVIWLQERVRLRDAEIKAMDITNDEMGVTIATLRADLAESRAALDKATESHPFSQHDELRQLRTSNHYMTEELTRLRAERKADAKDLTEARADVQRFEAALDAANRELAQARAERDEAVKQRDFAKDGEDNMRFMKVLWENECGFYRAQSVARLHEIDLGRRTIRALVVACRAMDVAGFMKMGHDRWYAIVRQWVRDIERIRSEDAKQAKQSGQQAGE